MAAAAADDACRCPAGPAVGSAPIPPWCGRISTPPGPAARCPRSWPRGAPPNDKNPAARPGREALGRSRGGLSTKIHLAAGHRCRPVSRILTPGQHGDCPQFIPLLAAARPPSTPHATNSATPSSVASPKLKQVPRRRDPLRQARLHVPGHGRRRLDPDLATRPGHIICGTTPWRRPRDQQRW
jgi:hypothetical protein